MQQKNSSIMGITNQIAATNKYNAPDHQAVSVYGRRKKIPSHEMVSLKAVHIQKFFPSYFHLSTLKCEGRTQNGWTMV